MAVGGFAVFNATCLIIMTSVINDEKEVKRARKIPSFEEFVVAFDIDRKANGGPFLKSKALPDFVGQAQCVEFLVDLVDREN